MRALVVVALLGASTAAHAQSTRYPPPPEDLDAEREQQSDFWDDALEPGRKLYDEKVDRAAGLILKRSDEARTTAIALLDEAAVLLPDRPDAWAWLGVIREHDHDYAGCTTAYATAWKLDATWTGSGDRTPVRPLALGLGTCRARTGDLDGAAEVLERLVARGDPRVESYYRLGEVYLALGRLDDARDVLAVALDSSPAETFYVHAAWALAIAADRARDPEAFEQAGQIAIARDPNVVRAGEPPAGFIVAGDRAYYLGIGAMLASAPERALFHLRGYAADEDAAWRTRALERLEEAATFDVARRVAITKTDAIDSKQITKAMVAGEPTLRACVKATPRLLVTVQVTMLGPPLEPKTGAKSGGAKAPPPAGVRASVVLSDDAADAAAVEAALKCVEKGAAKLTLPAPTTPGTWLSASMPVVWR